MTTTTAARRPLTTTILRTCRCGDCRRVLPVYTPACRINGRFICEGCSEAYEWNSLQGKWVLKK